MEIGYFGVADFLLGGNGLVNVLSTNKFDQASSNTNIDTDYDRIIYTGSPGKLGGTLPTGITEGPTFFVFMGLPAPARGVHVCVNVSNTGTSSIYSRGLLYTGWSLWKSVVLT